MIEAFRRKDYFPDRHARVLVRREPHHGPVARHRHEFFEIAIVLSGTGVHMAGRYRHELQAGDALAIDKRQAHGYENTRNLNLVNLLIRDEVLRRIGRELSVIPGFHALFAASPKRRGGSGSHGSHLHLSPGELAKVEEWVSCLESETHRRQQGGYLLAEAYLTLIVGVLSRNYGLRSPLRSRPEGEIAKVLRWMEKNLGQPLQVADMARVAGMSPRNFYRGFRRAAGATPGDCLQRMRIQRAAGELRDSPRRIGEIAQRCGFEDSNYFSRTFRRVMGVTPREYRKEH